MKVAFENACALALEKADGGMLVIHRRHGGRFCGLHALGRALAGRLDFDTEFIEVEGEEAWQKMRRRIPEK